jgi:hypothetical protein
MPRGIWSLHARRPKPSVGARKHYPRLCHPEQPTCLWQVEREMTPAIATEARPGEPALSLSKGPIAKRQARKGWGIKSRRGSERRRCGTLFIPSRLYFRMQIFWWVGGRRHGRPAPEAHRLRLNAARVNAELLLERVFSSLLAPGGGALRLGAGNEVHCHCYSAFCSSASMEKFPAS